MSVLNKDISEFTENAMMGMSAYSLLHRAIPDMRDGFKPVHRRIIISMAQNKTTNFTKSATVEGRVMALHPHGGSYGSIVGLVQKDRNNLPFLIGKGSWGQYTSKDQTPAAARYTEVKLGENAKQVTKELKENSVNYIPNYDGTIMVPEVLPVTYPSILTQAQSGMAIGFASSTLSYNIYELYNAIQEYFKDGKISMIYPDFPTGGMIIKNDEAANEIMDKGRGSLYIRSKVEIDKNKIYVHEIPYGVKREQIIQKIIDLNKEGKLKEITDVRDATSFKGMKITITLRKNADPKEVLAKLYRLTPMQSSVSANMNVLIDGMPKVVGVRELLIKWINWRKSVIIKGIENKITQLKSEYHILEGLKKINTGDAIDIIRFVKEDEVLIALKEEFDLTDDQAEYILKMPLRMLNNDRLRVKTKEIDKLYDTIQELIRNKDDNKFIEDELIIRMQETIKAIEPPKRKTEIYELKEKDQKIQKIISKELNKVEDYETEILISSLGMIYKTKNGSVIGKPLSSDKFEKSYKSTNDKNLMAVLPDGELGRIKIDEIGEGISANSKFDKEIIDYINPASKYVMIGYEDGQLVVIPGEKFNSKVTISKNGYYTGAKICLIEHLEDLNGVVIARYGKREKEIPMDKLNVKVSKASKGQRFVNTKEIVKYSVK